MKIFKLIIFIAFVGLVGLFILKNNPENFSKLKEKTGFEFSEPLPEKSSDYSHDDREQLDSILEKVVQ